MKYLKTFERVQEVDLVANPNWDEYVTKLFNEYVQIYSEDECELYPHDVIKFFDELDSEIEESDSIDVYKVEEISSKHNISSIFWGLAKAYGPNHACLKMALVHKYPDLIRAIGIMRKFEAWIIEDDEIESKIKELEEKIKEWKTIY
jgi:hypothetical protein